MFHTTHLYLQPSNPPQSALSTSSMFQPLRPTSEAPFVLLPRRVTQVARCLPARSSTPSHPSHTNPAAFAKQTTALHLSRILPTSSRKHPSTAPATSARLRRSVQACQVAAQTAALRHHSHLSATPPAPVAHDAHAGASSAAARESNSTVVAPDAAPATRAPRPAVAKVRKKAARMRGHSAAGLP